MKHDTTPRSIDIAFTTKQITRFWALVDKQESGCWEWKGTFLTNGYGTVSFYGKPYKAHRIAWLLTNGAIPDGMLICHRCDNPRCVRPDHLFLGTPLDNHNDMKAKGRAPVGERNGSKTHPERWKRGEDHYCAVLNEDIVREIRRRFVRFGPYRTNASEIARDLGIKNYHVLSVANGKSWTHVVD